MEKILIVDDEEVCCFFLKSCLELEGYEVETAVTGEQAITIADQFKPDILISDWMLKDVCSGVDVARTLGEKFPRLRIIFITGMAAEALIERAVGLLPFRVIEKPVDIDELLPFLTGEKEAA